MIEKLKTLAEATLDLLPPHLGLFEYKLSGDNFLHLRKPENPQIGTAHTPIQKALLEIR